LEGPACSTEEQNGSKVHTFMLMMALMMIIHGDVYPHMRFLWTVFPKIILSEMWNTRICALHSATMFRLTNLGVKIKMKIKINIQVVLLAERNIWARGGESNEWLDRTASEEFPNLHDTINRMPMYEY
jgi:hypothetical protein